MPTRAQVGSRDGVTKASMTPLTKSTTTRPERDGAGGAALPGDRLGAGQVARLDPGPEEPQPDCRGDEDRGQLEQAVREDQPPEVAGAVVAGHDRADDREVGDVLEQQVDHRERRGRPSAMQSAVTQALLIQTWAAKCEAAYSL